MDKAITTTTKRNIIICSNRLKFLLGSHSLCPTQKNLCKGFTVALWMLVDFCHCPTPSQKLSLFPSQFALKHKIAAPNIPVFIFLWQIFLLQKCDYCWLLFDFDISQPWPNMRLFWILNSGFFSKEQIKWQLKSP